VESKAHQVPTVPKDNQAHKANKVQTVNQVHKELEVQPDQVALEFQDHKVAKV
jgi:aryl-alcohol dehydrogenase-like predicted oxidoreductase